MPNYHLTPADLRQRKQALLPEIAKLAAEGLNVRQISEKLQIPKSTIGRWLRAARRKADHKQSLSVVKLIRDGIAFYTKTRDELIDGWRRSKDTKETRVVEKTGPVNEPDAAKQKKSVRKEKRVGDPAYLAKAMEAQKMINRLTEQLAEYEQPKGAGAGSSANMLETLTDDDLENLTPQELECMSSEQLFMTQEPLCAKHGLTGRRLTKEQLHDMTRQQLAELERKLQEEIQGTQTT
jgi:hypothetical protein